MEKFLKDEVFKLKGRLFTLTVLELLPCCLSDFQQHIELIYNKAPNMFSNTPIVLDLKLLKGKSFDLKGVMDLMCQYKMIAIAVQHASVIQQKSAAACGLSVLLSKDGNEAQPIEKALELSEQGSVVTNSIKHRKPTQKSKVVETKEQPETDNQDIKITSRSSKVITQPVRSGQQIYAKDQDLIILSSVSTGAELLADGHIHVYGTLRGRALAGIQGDKTARIFCSNLQAEMVSIAGQYLMPDSKESSKKGAKQILIEKDHLKIIDL